MKFKRQFNVNNNMCGIFSKFIRSDNPNILAGNAISHRGPDACIKVELKNTDLIFHRLAIIDPSEKSNVILNSNGVYLLCNGEIYNYRSLIHKYNLNSEPGSDCRVILELYHLFQNPALFVNELDGVFAFVIYDQNKQVIYAGRDRYGVRPLFKYYSKEQTLAFSSEAKAFPNDSDALINPVKPGTLEKWIATEYKFEMSSMEKWFDPVVHPNHLDYSTSILFIRQYFTEAVRKRLMSDRPIGFLLSGGLDSSLVASVASRLLSNRITTFSIGLENSPDLIAARKVARFLDSIHHEIIITQQDITSIIEQVVFHTETFDTTTIRASIPMFLLAKYISQNTNIKVIFSGEGADELFGGYLYFKKAPNLVEFQKETERLVSELYMYDVLRGDRTTAAWGLELRVPFLDADFSRFVMEIDPLFKMTKLEKKVLRDSFHGFLPDEILMRQKEAFSDGVGTGSIQALKEYAVRTVTETFNGRTPEQELYYQLFEKYYSSMTDIKIEKYWMPRWCGNNVKDPSATVLDVYKN